MPTQPPYRTVHGVPSFTTATERAMPTDVSQGQVYADWEPGDLSYLSDTDSLEIFTVGGAWVALSSSLSMIVAPDLATLQGTAAVAGQLGYVTATQQHMSYDGASWAVLGSKSSLLGVVTFDGANGTLNVNTLPTSSPALSGSFGLWSGPDYTPTAGPLNGVTITAGDTLLATPGTGTNGWSLLHGSTALSKSRAVNLFGIAAHDPTAIYESGSLVNRNGSIWSANADLGVKPWTPTDWRLVFRPPAVTFDVTANRPATASENDLFIDTTTGAVSKWTAGAWVSEVTLPLNAIPAPAGPMNDDDLLAWDAGSSSWQPVDGTALNPAANTGDILMWGGSTWVPTTPSLDDGADVDLAVAPTNGQALLYDTASGTWQAGDVAVGGFNPVTFVGQTQFDPAQLANPPGYGMPATAVPSPVTTIPMPGDRYFSAADSKMTLFTGAAGPPPPARVAGAITGTQVLDYAEVPAPQIADVGKVLTARVGGAFGWSAGTGAASVIVGAIVQTATESHEVTWTGLNLTTAVPGSIWIVDWVPADGNVPAGVTGIGGQAVKPGDQVIAVDTNGSGASNTFHIIVSGERQVPSTVGHTAGDVLQITNPATQAADWHAPPVHRGTAGVGYSPTRQGELAVWNDQPGKLLIATPDGTGALVWQPIAAGSTVTFSSTAGQGPS